MSVYIIAQIDIHDRAEYRKYEAGFMDVFSRYQGEVLVVEEHPEVIEGQWHCTRTAVLRFSDAEEARRFYHSPEYQALEPYRLRSSKNNMILARGLR
jgi:uncharacterized protein (DUF1330 family)